MIQPFYVPMRFAAMATCVAVLILSCGFQHAQGQTTIPAGDALEAGRWTGFMQNPGGTPFGVAIVLPGAGESASARLYVEQLAREEFLVEEARLLEGVLSFTWWPSFRLDCWLEREPDGVFVGVCSDEEASMGPVTIAPPGSVTSAERLSWERVQQRLDGFERLIKYRELDMLDGPRGGKVDAEGYNLYVLDEGEGMPVVFVSDLGEDLRVWDYVQHDVQAFARAISYSRSGLGYSDALPPSRQPERRPSYIAEELRTLLQNLEAEPPYILVAHGLGAVFARAFTGQYPGAVAGLVLVAPVHEGEGQRLGAMDEDSMDRYISGKSMLYGLASDTERGEFEIYRDMMETGAFSGAGALPDIPVVVLTSLQTPETPRWVGETEAGIRAKAELREELLDGITWSRHVQTRRSGTWFHREAPDFVVEAIRDVMDAASTGASNGTR